MTTTAEFIPIFILLGIAVSFAGAVVLLSYLFGRRKPNPVKQDFYECGVPPLVSQRMRFSIRFFIIAILFIIFDFETLVLLPWAIVYRQLLAAYGWAFPLLSIVIFLGILVVGFVYELAKGGIEWE